MPIIFTITYFYACIGVEIFNTSDGNYNHDENPYAWTNYTDFNSFSRAFLLLFQVIVSPKYFFENFFTLISF